DRETGVARAAISLRRGVADARALSGTALSIADEHVRMSVRVQGHQVGSEAVESHEAAVGGDRGADALAVPLRAARADAHALGRAAPAVADEDVEEPVGVPGHEVAGSAVEGHEAAVGGDRRALEADGAVPLRPGGVDAHALGRAALAVANEEVEDSVRVP